MINQVFSSTLHASKLDFFNFYGNKIRATCNVLLTGSKLIAVSALLFALVPQQSTIKHGGQGASFSLVRFRSRTQLTLIFFPD